MKWETLDTHGELEVSLLNSPHHCIRVRSSQDAEFTWYVRWPTLPKQSNSHMFQEKISVLVIGVCQTLVAVDSLVNKLAVNRNANEQEVERKVSQILRHCGDIIRASTDFE